MNVISRVSQPHLYSLKFVSSTIVNKLLAPSQILILNKTRGHYRSFKSNTKIFVSAINTQPRWKE